MPAILTNIDDDDSVRESQGFMGLGELCSTELTEVLSKTELTKLLDQTEVTELTGSTELT